MYNKCETLLKNSKSILENSNNLLNELFLNEGGDADESLAAEEVIAILIRNQDMNGFQVEKEVKNPKTDDFKFLVRYFTEIIKSPIKDQKDLIQTIQRSIVKMRSFGLPSNAEQYGTIKEIPTEIWIKVYGGESAAIMPKTDVINLEKHHSVKMRGPIHVLDSSQKQVGALCLYSLDQTKEKYSKKLLMSVKKEIKEMQEISAKLSRIPDEGKYKEFVDSYRKSNPNAKAKEVRDAAKKANLIVAGGSIRSGDISLSVNASKMLDVFQKNINELNNKIEKVFSSIEVDEDFKRVFLRESLSGEFMFDKKLASANSIIVWEKNFKNIDQISIDYAVQEILPAFRPPKFDTKSSGNWMSAVGKIQVDLSKFEKESDIRAKVYTPPPTVSMSNSFFKESKDGKKSELGEIMVFLEYSKKLLNTHMDKIKELKSSLKEGQLNEESFFEKIKSIFNKMIDAVKFVGEKIANYFSKIKSALSSSPSKIFDFFDLKLEVEPGYSVEIRF